MKMTIRAAGAALLLLTGTAGRAAILTETPEPLLESGGLERVSAGVFYQWMERKVESESGFGMELDARTYEGVLGFDVLPWLTLYACAGGSDARFKDLGAYGDDQLSWALGFNMNIWQWVGYGEAPAWRLSFKTRGEFSGYESESRSMSIDWLDYSVAFPVGYEVLFARHPESFSDIDHLELFAGPALSFLDGRYEQGGQGVDFEEKNSLGVAVGGALFITDTLFIELAGTYFDLWQVRGGIGYSFE